MIGLSQRHRPGHRGFDQSGGFLRRPARREIGQRIDRDDGIAARVQPRCDPRRLADAVAHIARQHDDCRFCGAGIGGRHVAEERPVVISGIEIGRRRDGDHEQQGEQPFLHRTSFAIGVIARRSRRWMKQRLGICARPEAGARITILSCRGHAPVGSTGLKGGRPRRGLPRLPPGPAWAYRFIASASCGFKE